MPGVVETTTYKVELLYDVKGDAGSKLDDIARHAEHAARGTDLLKRGLEALGIGVGIESAKKHLIDFNSEVQNAKISLSAMLQGNYGVGWDTAVRGADNLYAEFQRFSQLTPVTTQEMLEFGRGVAVATAQAGGGIKDITKITEQGVVAAKALGAESGYASLELTEMLQGNVSRRMRFAQQLLGLAHMDEKHFKELSASQRLDVVEKVLNSDAMKNATTAFSTSFSGVTSTLEDKLQILVGKVGLPLFQKITAEVSHWNEWIDKNQEKLNAFIDSVGHGLVTAFEDVKSAFAFIYDHADTFIAIGKVWAAIKIGNMAGNMLGGIGGGIGSLLGGGGRGIGGKLGGVGMVGLGAYELATLFGADRFGEKLADGFLGATAKRFGELETATKSLEDAQKHAAYELTGAGHSTRASLMQANHEQRAAQLVALRGIFDEYFVANQNRLGDTNKQLALLVGESLQRQFGDKLSAVGLTSSEVSQMGGIVGAISKIYEKDQSVHGTQMTAAFTSFATALIGPLLGYSKEQLDQQRISTVLFAKLATFLQGGGTIFSKEGFDLIKGVLGAPGEKDPYKAQANLNQNNTYNVQVEVAAKDPDRWIAELDSKLKRKVNAPTQARAASMFKGGSL